MFMFIVFYFFYFWRRGVFDSLAVHDNNSLISRLKIKTSLQDERWGGGVQWANIPAQSSRSSRAFRATSRSNPAGAILTFNCRFYIEMHVWEETVQSRRSQNQIQTRLGCRVRSCLCVVLRKNGAFWRINDFKPCRQGSNHMNICDLDRVHHMKEGPVQMVSCHNQLKKVIVSFNCCLLILVKINSILIHQLYVSLNLHTHTHTQLCRSWLCADESVCDPVPPSLLSIITSSSFLSLHPPLNAFFFFF